MTTEPGWSKDIYEKSISSRCWWYTPYDEGWDGCPDLSDDDELRQVVAMERALGFVPDWVQQIVERSINTACPCGHYLFPQPYLEIVSAIGCQTPLPLTHTCYTVERERKKAMMDYCLCLDAWLAGASPEAPARELMAVGHRRIDWHTMCADLWKVLGEHTELKDALVERALHQTRWWIKAMVWDDDLAADFGRDEYLGDYCETGCFAKDNGNPNIRAPHFEQGASPRIKKLEDKLAGICPDWKWFRSVMVEFSWLCAPKAFRYLEGLLWSIGKQRPAINLPSFPLENSDQVPGFLQCEDTYPNQDQAAQWWKQFCAALEGWWKEHPEVGNVADQVNQRLGNATPVKRWLVRLLLRKLKRLEENDGQFADLVKARLGRKRGARPVV